MIGVGEGMRSTVAHRTPGIFGVALLAVANLPAFSTRAPAAELTPPASVVRVLHFYADPFLPPIGYSRFCLRYPDDCKVHGVDFRHRNFALTRERQIELEAINREVNREIVPQLSAANEATEEWLISPPVGDCKDYAITKRHELLVRGWPSRALLLSEVVTLSGEHHVVLVVRLKAVDLVLDNLNTEIRPVAATYREYLWVRIETEQDPMFGARVRLPSAIQTATVSE